MRCPHVHRQKKKKENIPLIDDDDAIDESVPALFTGDLTPNSNNTVQPIALMRLGLFVPTLKGTKNSKRNNSNQIDASKNWCNWRLRDLRVIPISK